MIPAQIRSFLDERHVRFAVRAHPLRVTAQEIAQSAHVSGHRFAKVVVLRHGSGHLMAVLPADERVDTDRLAELLGGQVTLATEDEFDELFPGCERGAMPPLGELYRMPVVADACLAAHESIAFSGGTHEDVIEMRWQDFQRIAHPRVVDYGARASASGPGGGGSGADDSGPRTG
jgi:Ala-tRNA(Pro) deacylase